MGTVLMGASNAGVVGKNHDFQPISGSIACCEQFDHAIHDGEVDDTSRW